MSHRNLSLLFAVVISMLSNASAMNANEAPTWSIAGVVVDADGQPVAQASIRAAGWVSDTDDKQWPVTTNAKGVFQVALKAGWRYSPLLIASSADGQQMGYHAAFNFEDRKLLRIQLTRTRETIVRVQDHQGRSVAGARVAAITGEASTLGEIMADEMGVARLRLPSDLGVAWVYAMDPKRGFSYFENLDAWPVLTKKPLPGEISIHLEKPKQARVRLIGTDGQPIAGVKVFPWTIELPERLADINGLWGLAAETDQDGLAKFDWIPETTVRGVTFLNAEDQFQVRQRPRITTDKWECETILYKLATVRGRVTKPDGTPAVGIRLQGEGRGGVNNYYRAGTITDKEGRYELRPYPEQDLVIAVVDDLWAATSHVGMNLQEGETKDDVNFELTKGTLITGVATIGSRDAPAVDQTATLIQEPGGGSLVRWAQTNSAGRYRFRVGPGNYQLLLPVSGERREIVVKDQERIEQDVQADRLPRGMLGGAVTLKDGTVARDTVVSGESIDSPGHAGFRCTADATGKYETERWNDDTILFARSDSKNMSSAIRIGPDATNQNLELSPASTLKASFLDHGGDPLSELDGFVQINVTVDGTGASFNWAIRLNDHGEIEIPGLPYNIEGSLTLRKGERSFRLPFDVGEEPVTDLGEQTPNFEN